MLIVDYAETVLEDFSTKPFNPVDSLILAQLTYLNFSVLVPGIREFPQTIRIGDLLRAEIIPSLLENVRDPKSNYRLLLAAGMSPRFRDVRMCCAVDSLDPKEEKQFAAVTFLFADSTAYAAFRGTDMTVVGWKEDFNMGFTFPVPAQEESAAYLNAVAELLPQSPLMVGGHSKGGNLAVYSAMECDPAVQKRIVRVFSHDGPGFKEDVFSSATYAQIRGRIHKTLPQSSLVGMLLHHHEDYLVVESKQFWLMQHDPFSWVVNPETLDFCYREGLTPGAKHVNRAVNQWIASLDNQKRELFVSTLYSVIASMGVESVADLTSDWPKKVSLALESLRGIDGETKRLVHQTLRSLLALALKNIPFSVKGQE